VPSGRSSPIVSATTADLLDPADDGEDLPNELDAFHQHMGRGRPRSPILSTDTDHSNRVSLSDEGDSDTSHRADPGGDDSLFDAGWNDWSPAHSDRSERRFRMEIDPELPSYSYGYPSPRFAIGDMDHDDYDAVEAEEFNEENDDFDEFTPGHPSDDQWRWTYRPYGPNKEKRIFFKDGKKVWLYKSDYDNFGSGHEADSMWDRDGPGALPRRENSDDWQMVYGLEGNR
jgi:hypothetical protein